jgi:hypothetical protein
MAELWVTSVDFGPFAECPAYLLTGAEKQTSANRCLGPHAEVTRAPGLLHQSCPRRIHLIKWNSLTSTFRWRQPCGAYCERHGKNYKQNNVTDFTAIDNRLLQVFVMSLDTNEKLKPQTK